MSRVVIQGDASGTGDFTIAAPNSNTDRTLTLPDAGGTILTSGSFVTVDETNGKLGIGTSSPVASFDTVGKSMFGDSATTYTNIISGNSQFQPSMRVARNTADSAITIERFNNAAGGPFLHFGKGRSTTIGDFTTAVNNGDTLGQILFSGSDGDQFRSAAYIRVYVDGTPGNDDMPGRLVFGTTSDGAQSPVERMRIDSSGKVAMGTSTPLAAELTVFHSGMAGIITKMDGTAATNAMSFQNGYGQIGRIQVSGTTTSYITSSDYRLKENVVEITNGIDRVKLLNPSRFNFISDSDTTVDGFLAHEVQEVVPEAIAGAKDATKEEEYEVTPAVLDDDGNVVTEAVMGTRTVPDYQGIDQSKLVPLLTAALQEAITKIEALEARVTALENA